MSGNRDWHRLLALSLTDLFHGQPVIVEAEIDLSVRQQWLDVVLIRTEDGPLPFRLPDGFEGLGRRNLITFKSHQDTLDREALRELVGHSVNYRKQNLSVSGDLLPEDHFRLFALCVRHPDGLAGRMTVRELRPGVLEVDDFGVPLRIVVVHGLPLEEQNALLHLFAARAEQITYGRQTYRGRTKDISTLLRQLYDLYLLEGIAMPFSVEEFVRQANREIISKISPEERREIFRTLPPEERLAGLSPEDRLTGLSPEDRLTGLSPEDRLKGLSPEELDRLRRVLDDMQTPKDEGKAAPG